MLVRLDSVVLLSEPEVGLTAALGAVVEVAVVVEREDGSVVVVVAVSRHRFDDAQERSVGQQPPPREAGQEL